MVTLSLELSQPQGLELFPLLFAYNHVAGRVAQALRQGDLAQVVALQIPLDGLQRKVARRGLLDYCIALKGLEVALTEQLDETQGGSDERNLN